MRLAECDKNIMLNEAAKYDKPLFEILKQYINYDQNKVYVRGGYPCFLIKAYNSKIYWKYLAYFDFLDGSWTYKDAGSSALTDAGLRVLADYLNVNLCINNRYIFKTVYCYSYLASRITSQLEKYYEELKTKPRRLFNNDCSKCKFMSCWQNYDAGDWDCNCDVFGYDDPPDWAAAKTEGGCNLCFSAKKKIAGLNNELMELCYGGYSLLSVREPFERFFGVDIETGEVVKYEY